MPEKNIKYNYGDLEQLFKENVEQERKPRGENSCVAPHAFLEFHLDLFFIGKHVFEHGQNIESD